MLKRQRFGSWKQTLDRAFFDTPFKCRREVDAQRCRSKPCSCV
jgi:hypothetical protein